MTSSHIFQVIAAVIEFYFCTGIFFGWANLAKIYIGEGFFSCGNTTIPENAVECSDSLTTVFVMSSTCFSVFGLFGGIMYDQFGTAVTRYAANALFIVGVALVAMASPGSTDIFVTIGVPIIAISGICLLTTNFQVSNYFTGGRGVVLNLFNGSIDSSSSAALVIFYAYQGMGYTMTWMLYAGMGCYILFRTLFLLPIKQIPYPLPESWTIKTPISQCRNQKEDTDSTYKDALMNEKTEKIEVLPFKSLVFSPLYISTVLFFILNVFRVYYYLATMMDSTAELIQMENPNATKTEAMNQALVMAEKFGVVQFCGVIFAPINGLLIDAVMRSTGSSYKSLAISIFCVTLLGSAMSAVALVPSAQLQYVTFVLSAIHRAFVFGCNASVIGMIFPMEYFGKLYGIAQFSTTLSSLVISPLQGLAQTYSFRTVNTWILFMEIGTLFHVVVCLYCERRNKSSKKCPEET